MISGEPVIETRGLGKEYSRIPVLKNINLAVQKGEILTIVGENGAGKSTLVRILSGIISHGAYSGEFTYGGTIAKFRNPREAQDAGVAIIHQEISLIRTLSVGENIYLGRWPLRNRMVDWNGLHTAAARVLAELGLDTIDSRTPVYRLGVSQLQLVAIARALSQDSKVLILDEPTAALAETEVKLLFGLLRDLKKRGVTIIYISHRLREVLDLADRIAVLRDGQLVDIRDASDLTYDRIVTLMIGREIANAIKPREWVSGRPVALELRKFCVEDSIVQGRQKVKNVSLKLCRGEILGIAGLLGAGRTELAMALFGDRRWSHSGEILLNGEMFRIRRPNDAIQNGIALLTEDRQNFGLIPQLSVTKNLTLAVLRKISSYGVISARREKSLVQEFIKRLKIRLRNTSQRVTSLSGGNQQKVLVARWLASDPHILIMDEPTRGIDVGTKAEIYMLMRQLAEQGMAIMMISSDLIEILEVSDRILVIHEGTITGEFTHKEASEEAIMACATGKVHINSASS